MLRFLLMRIASAIPVLLVLSVVTFAIIQAPPGDYGDYIRSQLINQGGASFAEADAQAQAYRESSTASMSRCRSSTSTGSPASSPAAISATASTTTSRSPTWSASACRARSLLALVCQSSRRSRHHLRHPRRDPAIHLGRHAASVISFLGMTVPRFLLALIIVYILVFQFNVQEIGSFFSPQYGGAPWSLGQVRRSRQARLAGGRRSPPSAGSPTICASCAATCSTR